MTFVDTGAWFAFFVPADPAHPRVRKWLTEHRILRWSSRWSAVCRGSMRGLPTEIATLRLPSSVRRQLCRSNGNRRRSLEATDEC